jgi:hypothetical protein
MAFGMVGDSEQDGEEPQGGTTYAYVAKYLRTQFGPLDTASIARFDGLRRGK